jgi:hypothetical protein
MGGPWTYADDGHDTDGMAGADREYYESLTDGLGCGIVGRNMYEAAGAWGGTNPFPGTLIVLTHRTEDQPDPSTGFTTHRKPAPRSTKGRMTSAAPLLVCGEKVRFATAVRRGWRPSSRGVFDSVG